MATCHPGGRARRFRTVSFWHDLHAKVRDDQDGEWVYERDDGPRKYGPVQEVDGPVPGDLKDR
jgi:hypothetical protein